MCLVCDVGGPTTDHRIRVRSKVWHFEMNEMWGPLVVSKRGMPLKHQPMSPRHPFLMAMQAWWNQGKHTDAEGFCVWQAETDPMLPEWLTPCPPRPSPDRRRPNET